MSYKVTDPRKLLRMVLFAITFSPFSNVKMCLRLKYRFLLYTNVDTHTSPVMRNPDPTHKQLVELGASSSFAQKITL